MWFFSVDSSIYPGDLSYDIIYRMYAKPFLKGELSPNLLSEMSLPGIEALIEKLSPKNIREIGEGEPL